MLSPELLARLLEFRRERDWEQFHTPKNLAAALAVEAGERMGSIGITCCSSWQGSRQ